MCGPDLRINPQGGGGKKKLLKSLKQKNLVDSKPVVSNMATT